MIQRDKILELLRTRNLGGGQQGIMEWSGTKTRSSEMPLSGDHLKQAFGDGPEARSRASLESAIKRVGKFDPEAYVALRNVFDADEGGYNDLEFYTERAPAVAEAAQRGIDWLVWLLPESRYKLTVEPGRVPMTHDEREEQKRRNAGVYEMWTKGVANGEKKGVLVSQIADVYGVSERRVYQIVEQESPLEHERGRPRKES